MSLSRIGGSRTAALLTAQLSGGTSDSQDKGDHQRRSEVILAKVGVVIWCWLLIETVLFDHQDCGLRIDISPTLSPLSRENSLDLDWATGELLPVILSRRRTQWASSGRQVRSWVSIGQCSHQWCSAGHLQTPSLPMVSQSSVRHIVWIEFNIL